MKPKIPDRWIPYTTCGDVIEGTRIICFKVPLHKNVQSDPEITKIWDIPAVLEEIPKLGAVIDLTNTGRYYNPSEFEAAGVMHRKILMPGREIPSEDKVQAFMSAVDEFLGKDCDSLIGVHCTHGLNRTGYMVCRYLRDRLNIPAEDAIKKFEKARGYKIERDIYLASLLEKELPRPDFEADSDDSQRRVNSQSQHGNDGQMRNRNGYQPRHRYESKLNSDESQTRSIDRHNENKNVVLTKSQRRNLKRKIKRQEEGRVKFQKSQVRIQENRARSQENQAKFQENQARSQENYARSQENRARSQEKGTWLQKNRSRPKKRKIYNYN